MSAARDGLGPPAPGSERGFLLVGVVIFVLALTILGLSLFSLSSYEAQFLGGSTRDLQAFYAATGGIERAKHVMAETDSLESVKLDLPFEGVVYARARFADDHDSTGSVDWSGGRPIEVRVVAEHQGARRTVEATYRAIKGVGLYRNLVTTPAVLRVLQHSAAPAYANAYQQTFLAGTVSQGVNDFGWVAYPTPNSFGIPHVTDHDPTIPTPDVDGYLATWSAGAPNPVKPNAWTYQMTIPLGQTYAHFMAPSEPSPPPPVGAQPNFGFYTDEPTATFHVVAGAPRGTAVLLMPGGLYSFYRLTITGDPNLARLVIVAKRTTNPNIPLAHPGLPNAGVWLQGGITSNIPVIVVSDGTVAIDHFSDNAQTSTFLGYTSMFAGGVMIKGPRPGFALDVRHPPSALQLPPLTDALILDPLYAEGILPNGPVGGGTATYMLVPGTWREVTESNPS